MKESIKLILVLGIISMISGMILAQTYIVTEPIIGSISQERLEEAIFELIPKAKEYKMVEGIDIEMYEGFDEAGNLVGVAFVSEKGGFQGTIKMMAGIDVDKGVLTSMTVLSHTETPGLGSRITETGFKDMYIGRNKDTVEDIDAITGATITSKAVSSSLKESIEQIMNFYNNGGEKR